MQYPQRPVSLSFLWVGIISCRLFPLGGKLTTNSSQRPSHQPGHFRENTALLHQMQRKSWGCLLVALLGVPWVMGTPRTNLCSQPWKWREVGGQQMDPAWAQKSAEGFQLGRYWEVRNKRGPGCHCGLTDPGIGPEKSKCDFPTLHPQKILSGYKIVISVDFVQGIYFLTLFDQVVMLSNSENNPDGVYYFCENKFCILFRRDKKDCTRKSKYITRVI